MAERPAQSNLPSVLHIILAQDYKTSNNATRMIASAETAQTVLVDQQLEE